MSHRYAALDKEKTHTNTQQKEQTKNPKRRLLKSVLVIYFVYFDLGLNLRPPSFIAREIKGTGIRMVIKKIIIQDIT